MRIIAKFILTVLVATLLSSCDPTHELILENKKQEKIEVIYYPVLEQYQVNNKPQYLIKINDREFNRIYLNPNETMIIGNVVARYEPNTDDIDLDYLEIRSKNDTIQFKGKRAIYSMLRKIESLNWRLTIK